MKLWYSYLKELKLASRGMYFYLEIGLALILLLVLLFVIPESFSGKGVEYLYLDMPEQISKMYHDEILTKDIDGQVENVEVKSGDDVFPAHYYVTDEKKIYIVESKDALVQITDTERPLVGAIINIDESGKTNYEYYLQGYESERLKNLYLVIHNKDIEYLEEVNNNQKVVSLSNDYQLLSDKENLVPSFLTFNGSLMGLFIIAAYIFLDKKEGVIKAYAVSASPVWQYLMSKALVILTTTIVTSFIIVVPVMGLQPNYVVLLVLLITSGFFASALGLVLASFYHDLMKAFGAMLIAVMVLLLPNIAYFVPSWEPTWIKLIPTYSLLQGFKECISVSGDMPYTLLASLGFLGAGAVLFVYANYRFKKTLTV